MTMLQRALRSVPLPTNSGGGAGQWRQDIGGLIRLSRTGSGRTVTRDDAFSITAFQRGVRLRALTVAQLPLHTYDRASETSRVPVRNPFDRYLWERPNPEHLPIDFWSCFVGHRVSTGNAYLYVETYGGGLPLHIWPIDPQRVKVGRAKDGRKIYQIDDDLPQVDFTQGGNIVHSMGFSVNGLVGISPLQGEAMGLALNAEEYASRTFSTGSVPGGILKTDQQLTEKQAEAMATRWDRFHAGTANAHKIAVLDRNVDFRAVSINPEDAQLLDTRKFQVTEIARMLGVPPHLIGDVEKSTSWGTGIEEQTLGYLTFTVAEDIIGIEQLVSLTLLSGTSRYAKFETKALLRTNANARADFYGKMKNAGVMSINEIRADEDMEPIGPEGDVRTAPLNMGVVGQEGKLTERDKVDAAGILIRSGFAPDSTLAALGLPAITHLGLLPVTVQKPVDPVTGGAVDPETGEVIPGTEQDEPSNGGATVEDEDTTSQDDDTDVEDDATD